MCTQLKRLEIHDNSHGLSFKEGQTISDSCIFCVGLANIKVRKAFGGFGLFLSLFLVWLAEEVRVKIKWHYDIFV